MNNHPINVSFYHLTKTTLEAFLPSLLDKILKSGGRVVMESPIHERLSFLSSHLWTYNPVSFLPHGCEGEDDFEKDQPIWLNTSGKNVNKATHLIVLDSAQPEDETTFQNIIEVFNGHDDEAVAFARSQWMSYKNKNYTLVYYKQDEEGKWTEKRT
jgi:DNA polymerase III subunit chi